MDKLEQLKAEAALAQAALAQAEKQAQEALRAAESALREEKDKQLMVEQDAKRAAIIQPLLAALLEAGIVGATEYNDMRGISALGFSNIIELKQDYDSSQWHRRALTTYSVKVTNPVDHKTTKFPSLKAGGHNVAKIVEKIKAFQTEMAEEVARRKEIAEREAQAKGLLDVLKGVSPMAKHFEESYGLRNNNGSYSNYVAPAGKVYFRATMPLNEAEARIMIKALEEITALRAEK